MFYFLVSTELNKDAEKKKKKKAKKETQADSTMETSMAASVNNDSELAVSRNFCLKVLGCISKYLVKTYYLVSNW